MNFFGMFKGSAFKTIRLFKVDRLVDLGVAISGDGRLAMVCEEGGHIGVWDPHSGKKSCTLSEVDHDPLERALVHLTVRHRDARVGNELAEAPGDLVPCRRTLPPAPRPAPAPPDS